MLTDAFVMANLETGRVDETDARTTSETSTQVGAERNQRRGQPFDETLIARSLREGARPVLADLFCVIPFEVSVALLVERN